MLAPAHCPNPQGAWRIEVGVVELLRGLASGAAALVERYERERRIAHDICYLSSFDDRTLADIGLTRVDIEGNVRRRIGEALNSRTNASSCAEALRPSPSVYDTC
jgi:uncharacterized protein YjiS (DUF1127 family)